MTSQLSAWQQIKLIQEKEKEKERMVLCELCSCLHAPDTYCPRCLEAKRLKK